MPERASHLIVTISPDGEIEVFGGYSSQAGANAVYDKLQTLLKATTTRMKLIEVPELESVAPVAATLTPAPAALAAPTTPATPPAKFVRAKSQAEFEAETIAMMNGEISMDGIPFRDADAPLSEGGAIS